METPAFLKPIQSYPGEIVQFIERIPGVDVTGDGETVLEQLELSRRYWEVVGVSDWRVALFREGGVPHAS